jgi:hypothetical protein
MSNENTPSAADIGPAIDALYALREMRLGIERKAKELKEEEVIQRNKIFELLANLGLTKASGAVATAGIKVSNVPLVEDWDKLHEYIKTTGEFDLMQKRISVTAWRARYDEGIEVPGVSKVEDVDISLTKASRSV